MYTGERRGNEKETKRYPNKQEGTRAGKREEKGRETERCRVRGKEYDRIRKGHQEGKGKETEQRRC